MSTFTLPDLPYSTTALEPYIDATTMSIHHSKHHQTYINNLNGVVAKYEGLKGLSLDQINAAVGTPTVPKEVATAVKNNGGGHWNHSFFWKVLAPPSETNGPSADLKAAADAAFGSMDELKAKFNAAGAARFGSGWAWLVVKEDGSLAITSTANQDNPLMASAEEAGTPIYGLDVWEHAYYLKYQNRRPEYLAAAWNVVNWEAVNAYYSHAVHKK